MHWLGIPRIMWCFDESELLLVVESGAGFDAKKSEINNKQDSRPSFPHLLSSPKLIYTISTPRPCRY
jgi:hypothetical protein